MTCAICQSERHTTENCPRRHTQKADDTDFRQPSHQAVDPAAVAQIERLGLGVCGYCGTRGHTSKNCPRKH